MTNWDENEVVEGPELSELEQFALLFHQDFALESTDFHEAARQRISELSLEQRTNLRAQMGAFVSDHEGDLAQLRQDWLEMGAGYWPRDPNDGLTLLRDFIEML